MRYNVQLHNGFLSKVLRIVRRPVALTWNLFTENFPFQKLAPSATKKKSISENRREILSESDIDTIMGRKDADSRQRRKSVSQFVQQKRINNREAIDNRNKFDPKKDAIRVERRYSCVV